MIINRRSKSSYCIKIMATNNTINPNLLRIVQASPCDIDFWSQQLTEHALFLHRLLNPQTVPGLKEEARQLYASWYNVLQKRPIAYNATLINNTYGLLETVHNKISQINPINVELPVNDFHALVRHMLLEQTYFVRLVDGKMTVKEELLFWAQENAEHTELVSHLLPPGELKDRSALLADALNRNRVMANYDASYFVPELELIQNSNLGAGVIHGAVHSGQIRTVNDQMLEHEMREARKGEERVQYLLTLLR